MSSSASIDPNHHPHSNEGGGDQTYEATRARRSAEALADKVQWRDDFSFRGQPYRQLHHQKGWIGTFTVRLLEARGLKRSYWSALALGPVKHLNLSKAHGAVSSYCTFSLDFVNDNDENNNERGRQPNNNRNNSSYYSSHSRSFDSSAGSDDRKPAAKKQPTNMSSALSSSSSSSLLNADSKHAQKSPVIANNNNPVWDNCSLEFPLQKGAMPVDGMRIQLQLRVDEDSTAVETMLPLIGTNARDARVLGWGHLDVTNLCLGETRDGTPLPGIQEAWIPISLPPDNNNDNSSDNAVDASASKDPGNNAGEGGYDSNDPLAPPTTLDGDSKQPSTTMNTGRLEEDNNGMHNSTGRVRVLVSYEPNGLEPQKGDIVALECFARRHLPNTSCRPILSPPLCPLKVLEKRAAYLLLSTTASRRGGGRRSSGASILRLHRNAVFVVERQSLVDAAQNLACLPTDVLMQTPLGQTLHDMAGPVVVASQEVMMPALLSFKLFWMALRTTTLASISGVQALSQTFLEEGASSLLPNNNNNNSRNSNNNSRDANDSATPTLSVNNRSSSGGSSVKLVQL